MTAIPRVALGDLVTITGGGTPLRSNPAYFDGDIPWVTPKDMKTPELCGSLVRITERGLRESATKLVPPGSVLVVVRSGVLKHSVPIAINRVPVALNQDMKALSTGPRLQPEYLAHYLRARTPEILRWVRAATHGAGDNFPVERLRDLELPLPPPAEQRRVAAILDLAEGLRAKRRQAVALLDALVQSSFVDLFGDPVANPCRWPVGPSLGDVADIVSGITKGRKVNGSPTREVSYLAVANVQDRHLDMRHVKTIAATESEIERYRLKREDLLLTEGGDPDKLGRGTLWADEIGECIHQNHIFRVRLTDGRFNPTYLNWLVGSARGRLYFLRSAKQTTGIASINLTQLRGFPLLRPPLELQSEFSRRLSAVQDLRAKVLEAEVAHEALFASLQHRAFRGEL